MAQINSYYGKSKYAGIRFPDKLLLENGREEEAAAVLKLGISLCEEKNEILPFARKKEELSGYLEFVYGMHEPLSR